MKETYNVYWESQDSQQCGLHALRSMCYKDEFENQEEFKNKVKEVVTRFVNQNRNKLEMGETQIRQGEECEKLDVNTIIHVSNEFGLDVNYVNKKNQNEFVKVGWTVMYPEEYSDLKGYYVNKDNHWYTIRKKGNKWYNLDSINNNDPYSPVEKKEIYEILKQAWQSGTVLEVTYK